MRLKVQLIRSEDNSPVEAYIVELAQKHIDDYENPWRESLRTFQTEDKFWNWIFKLEFITRQENQSGYAIEYLDLTQGLMMVETQLHGSRDLIGKRLVYIEALTSAPWKRKEIQNPPRLKGAG